MRFEVEQKHPVGEFEPIERALAAMGVVLGAAEEERDLYFAHPVRDFGATDEALRIRCRGGEALITYKGPKIDRTTKTRREIELPLGPESSVAARWRALLEALGFTAVAEVRKSRRKAAVSWQGATIALTLDDAGAIGRFVELEIETEQAGVDWAKGLIRALAEHLGLDRSERRSYLELSLVGQEEADPADPPGDGGSSSGSGGTERPSRA